MNANKRAYLRLLPVALLFLALCVYAWVKPADDFSLAERRPLAQMPAFKTDEVLSGDFMADFEDYATDQFMIEFDRAFSGIFNLSWLLRGEGEMLVQRAPSAAMPQPDVVAQLIRMCNDLHADVRELKQELAATKAEVEKLKRAHYGYASVAADGMSGIEFEKVK
jgi:hypothetical protein